MPGSGVGTSTGVSVAGGAMGVSVSVWVGVAGGKGVLLGCSTLVGVGSTGAVAVDTSVGV